MEVNIQCVWGEDGQLFDAAVKESSLGCFLEGAFNLLMVFPFVFWLHHPSVCVHVHVCSLLSVYLFIYLSP